jgi:ApaG protein
MNRNNSFASLGVTRAPFRRISLRQSVSTWITSRLFAAMRQANTTSMKELFQHAATTQDVTVRVAVNFLPEQSRIEAGKWFWVYHIRIENDSDDTLQLMTRHWRITDGRGVVNFVDGDGVVGESPVLKPGQSHDYVSGCPLATPNGSMEGHYTFRRHDGSELRVAIPHFPLAAPATAG